MQLHGLLRLCCYLLSALLRYPLGLKRCMGSSLLTLSLHVLQCGLRFRAYLEVRHPRGHPLNRELLTRCHQFTHKMWVLRMYMMRHVHLSSIIIVMLR